MAYKPLSHIVAERMAQMRGDEPAAAETHHIATPRQHDIERIIQKEEKPLEPHPQVDKSLLDQVRQKPAATDYSQGRSESSRLLRDMRDRENAGPRPQKISAAILRQIRASKRPGMYHPK